MNAAVYARYELLRAFRNRRFFIMSFGFPLVLYYAIAAPNRHVHDLGGTGLSAPLYFMVGLSAFGTMNAVLATGARIAGERNHTPNARRLHQRNDPLRRLLEHRGNQDRVRRTEQRLERRIRHGVDLRRAAEDELVPGMLRVKCLRRLRHLRGVSFGDNRHERSRRRRHARA